MNRCRSLVDSQCRLDVRLLLAVNLVLLAMLLLIHQNAHGGPQLIFKSGFENGVVLDPPKKVDANKGQWRQNIRGSDVPGHSWPMPIGNGNGWFFMLADTPNAGADIKPYMENRIETVTGWDGKQTKALYMSYKKAGGSIAQNWYYHSFSNGYGKELYIKYRMKISKDLPNTFVQWQNYFFWKENPTDYRFEPGWKVENGKVVWWSKGDKTTVKPFYNYWEQINRNVPVPLGTWFTI